MSGRYEKEMQIDNIIRRRLSNMPNIATEYYYSLLGAGKSYRTAQTYIDALYKFINFTYPNHCSEYFYQNVTSSNINRFIASLRTKVVKGQVKRTSDSLRTSTWSALNSFFQFLVPDYIDNNPVASTTRPKMKDNPQVSYLDNEEIAQMLKTAEEKATGKLKNRDLCILKLGFATGLRRSAIVQIDIADLDFDNNQIRVTEKGDKDVYIHIGENLKNQILLWLNDRAKYFRGLDTDALFISQERKRLSERSLMDVMNRYAGDLNKKVTPHTMRHSCATNLYEKTGDIYLCAKQLNHANVTTTQRYAELSRQRQIEAANILDDMI